nr:uncharacterized protein LOC107425293 [Ziziphus jujuba var. spinosa]
MDSQDSNNLPCSQQLSNDNEGINVSSSLNTQHVNNSSQLLIHNSMPQATTAQFSNQFPHFSFQPSYLFNSMNASYSSHVSQQFGSGFTYQGLLNAPTIPFDTRNANATKESKHKSKATQKSNSQSSVSNKNWTKAEDVALTKAWIYISVDSDIGSSQKNTAMWDCILLTWKDNMGVEYSSVRNTNRLQCRWVKIQGAVNKFHGLYERLERNPQSGTTPEDMDKVKWT